VGGTGRFAGATGEADFTGELHIIGISPGGLVRETVTLELLRDSRFLSPGRPARRLLAGTRRLG